ncbi:MAG: hypothetical protein ACR2H4_06565 [Pyrinomonadaceae bacterium]
METDLDKRYQTLVVLWFALLMSVGMYFLICLFAAPEIADPAGAAPNTLLIVILLVGVLLVALSFLVKHKLLEGSVERQDMGLVQKSLIVACAMCEVSAVLGLLGRFLIGSRYYYVLFVFSALGIALHFPRRIQLQAAHYRNQQQLS